MMHRCGGLWSRELWVRAALIGLAAGLAGAQPSSARAGGARAQADTSTLVHPEIDLVGVPLAEQLSRALEIGRWATHQLSLHDGAALKVDPVTGESLLATRLHLARGEPAGDGVGTADDPFLVGDDGRDLGARIDAIIDGASGPFAIYIDNAIDTSTAPTPPVVNGFLGNGDDPVHVIAWDRTGEHPRRRVVIDAFRPIADAFDEGESWSPGSNPGEHQVKIRAGVAVGDLRIGPATQNAISSDLFYTKAIDDLDGAAIGQHRYHFDPDARVLTVRLADGADPGALDLRLSSQPNAFLQVATGRYLQRGLRISGYNSAAPNQSYNQRFISGDDRVYRLENCAWDFAFRHAAGMSGGAAMAPQSQRYQTVDCEYGFGDAATGYTASVAFAFNGGQHAVEIGPRFVGGARNTEAAAAQLMHTVGVDTSRSFITIDSDIDCEHASFRWGGHGDRDTTDPVYSILIACRMSNLQRDKRATQVAFDNLPQAYCDASVAFQTHARSFSGVQAAPVRIRTEAFRSRYRLSGAFSLESNALRTLYQRGGGNRFASFPVVLDLTESVFDLSGLNHGGFPPLSIWRSGESLESLAVAQGALCVMRNSVLRAPAQGGFTWFHGATRGTPGWTEVTDFTGSAFVGAWPETQTPDGALTFTDAAWASLDPASTVPPDLVYPWLIDQAQALDVEPVKIRARFDPATGRLIAPPNKQRSSGRCRMGVALLPPGEAPTPAMLLAREVAQIDPALGGEVVIDAPGDVYLFTRDPMTATAVAPVMIGGVAEEAADLNADGVVDGADLALVLGAWGACAASCEADLNADGVVDGADLGLLLGAWG